MEHLYNILKGFFHEMEFSDILSTSFSIVICLIAIYLLAFILFFITKKILGNVIYKLILRTKSKWDDYLLNRKFFSAWAHLPAAFVFYFVHKFSDVEIVDHLLFRFSQIYFILIGVMILVRLAKAAMDIYDSTEYSKGKPIKGYIQLVNIFIYFIAGVCIIAILIGKSPMTLIAGLGAVAAVLLLVFKDAILGLVAGVQLSANNMVKPGDWIAVPKHGADGTVIDISLTTVKVQNWDKTISSIPIYSLVSDSFTNWRGMEESGGRRIKRSINIDMKTIKFCNTVLLKKFLKFRLIRDYVETKQQEIEEFNRQMKVDEENAFNGRRQTNLGIFRKYLEAYLSNHPKINTEMTFLVRHLQPTEKGLPIEIYVFSSDKRWAIYEEIQADIFDHIFAVLPEFELKIFQNPSGNDFQDFLRIN